MRRISKRWEITATMLLSLGLLGISMSGSASAHSGTSTYTYPGGDVLQANAWIQNFTWTGCGDWSTSAKLLGYNPPYAAWIKNVATLTPYGIGASISGSGPSGSFSGGSPASFSWTNTNAWISDLSGNVCGNVLTVYISLGSTAVSYVPQYGSPRTASVSL